MGRSQWIAVAVASLLLLLTYLGCPVRPPEMEEGFKRGPLEATGLESLIRAARATLKPAEVATLASLEGRLEEVEDVVEKRQPLLQQLAGEWYRAGHPAISGIYARKIAEDTNTEEAWSIAATTFSICLKQEDADDKTRQFCSRQAEAAYQAAISLDPREVDHRINLALTYTDYPPKDNPMKGILQLRELVENYPDNPRVYISLAQLSIRTNQWENAAKRLEKAVELAPDNPDAVCNLARVYETLKRMEAAAAVGARCRELVK